MLVPKPCTTLSGLSRLLLVAHLHHGGELSWSPQDPAAPTIIVGRALPLTRCMIVLVGGCSLDQLLTPRPGASLNRIHVNSGRVPGNATHQCEFLPQFLRCTMIVRDHNFMRHGVTRSGAPIATQNVKRGHIWRSLFCRQHTSWLPWMQNQYIDIDAK